MTTQEQQEQLDQQELLDLRETTSQRARRKQLEAVASQARWEKLVLQDRRVAQAMRALNAND